MTTEQRTCPCCGTEFTWTSAAPRQKFCSIRCKHRWWDTRRRQATAALNQGSIPLPAGQQRGDDHGAVTHDGRGDPARHHPSSGTLAAVPACPHCSKPVAIVAWLVPPAAASVATPPRHAVAVRDNQ